MFVAARFGTMKTEQEISEEKEADAQQLREERSGNMHH